MSINNNDDYDKLARILYPSIEASGNVYYGQTRKLTMDEILGKNELNFESHIETFKQGDETYKSYFINGKNKLDQSIFFSIKNRNELNKFLYFLMEILGNLTNISYLCRRNLNTLSNE